MCGVLCARVCLQSVWFIAMSLPGNGANCLAIYCCCAAVTQQPL